MTRRLAASLLIVLATANIARADVPGPSSMLSVAGIAVVIGMVVAGTAVSLGVVIGGVIWMRRRSRTGDNDE